MYRWMRDRLEVGKIKGIDFFSFSVLVCRVPWV